jgi:hypothetical protein
VGGDEALCEGSTPGLMDGSRVSRNASSGGNPTTRTYPLTLTASAGAYTQTTTLTLVVKWAEARFLLVVILQVDSTVLRPALARVL